ncbi:Uncharacterised protein [uncultured archaeon]|nr:Uncharacterised protein [uncultured archaeon]
MLERETAKKIYDSVFAKPRTIQELAALIGKSWVTTDRYVDRLAGDEGIIQVRTFRGGTRGAIKVVYWNLAQKATDSIYQKELYDAVVMSRKKDQLSPFDIFQFVDKNRKSVRIEHIKDKTAPWTGLPEILLGAREGINVFSGNISWINSAVGRREMQDVLYEVAKSKVPVKVAARVDLATYGNFSKMEAINRRAGFDAIEIRHKEQPLRGFIIDNKTVYLRELKLPEEYRPGELKRMAYIYYTISDEKWVDWFSKVFWDMFRSSVDGRMRIQELKSIA